VILFPVSELISFQYIFLRQGLLFAMSFYDWNIYEPANYEPYRMSLSSGSINAIISGQNVPPPTLQV
jgi:hypothetical protein